MLLSFFLTSFPSLSLSLVVIAFAGDALICVFSDTKKRESFTLTTPSSTHSLGSVHSTIRALNSANTLKSVQFVELATHIGISYGEMKLAFLGGTNSQWIYVINGECLSELHSCIEDAEAQMVVVTNDFYDKITEVQAVIKQSNQDFNFKSDNDSDIDLSLPTFSFIPIGKHNNYKLHNTSKSDTFDDNLGFSGRKMISQVSKKKAFFTASSASSANSLSTSNYPAVNINNSSSIYNANASANNFPTNGTPSSLLKLASSNLADMKYKKLSCRTLSVKNLSLENIYAYQASLPPPTSSHVSSNVPPPLLHSSSSSSYYPPRPPSLGSTSQHKSTRMEDMNLRYRRFVESLTLFVPLPVVNALYFDSNHQISELRTVTTMFLCLDSYNPRLHSDPTTLQSFFLLAQQGLLDSGGFLRQFLIDDKGCVLIGMWGIPSYTYANNCSRALYCAAYIHNRIHEIFHRCSIGITTGTVFCGTIGALERCDYVGIGSDVNLAARFMAKAKGQIYVDENTFNNLNERNRNLLTLSETALTFKGIPHPIAPYIYESNEFPSLTEVDSKLGDSKNRLLKKRVMHLLDKQLDKIANPSPYGAVSPADYRHQLVRASNRGRFKSHRLSDVRALNNVEFMVLVGQPGTGKATAAQYFRLGARERGLQTIHLIAQSKHHNVPYAIIREFFLELVGPENFKSSIQQSSLLKSLIDDAYPEDDYSESDRWHARLMIELILGISTMHEEFTNWASVDDGSVQSPSRQASRRMLGSASSGGPGNTEDLQLEIEEEFRLTSSTAYPDFMFASPARFNSMRSHQLRETFNFDTVNSSQKSAIMVLAEEEGDRQDTPERGRTPGRMRTGSSSSARNGQSSLSVSPVRTSPTRTSPARGASPGKGSRPISASYGSGKKHSSTHTSQPRRHSTLQTENENEIFFKIIAVFLMNTPIALIIENAHFCDELTWNALYLLINGKNLDVSVLLTVKSNPTQRLRTNGGNASTSSHSHSTSFHNNGGVLSGSNSINPTDFAKVLQGSASASSPYTGGNMNRQKSSSNGPSTVTGLPPSLPPSRQTTTNALDTGIANTSTTSMLAHLDSEQMIVTFALDHISCESFKNICSHSHCTIHEMKNLSEDEVKCLLLHKLKVSTLSDELCHTVFNVSSGNAYWCNMICDVIQEQGLHRLDSKSSTISAISTGGKESETEGEDDEGDGEAGEGEEEEEEEVKSILSVHQIDSLLIDGKTTSGSSVGSSGSSGGPSKRSVNKRNSSKKPKRELKKANRASLSCINTLRSLILFRFELLSTDYQMILKYSSVIGSEFTPQLLQTILPIKYSDGLHSNNVSFAAIESANQSKNHLTSSKRSLQEILEHLEKHGFLYCIGESPSFLYTFQNELIQRTLYELIPPR
jgi:class 3 adenylate cyclase